MQPLSKLYRRLEGKLRRTVFSPRRWLQSRVVPTSRPLTRLGTIYGGWHVVEDESLRGGVALLCGAGEDISFDLEMQSRFSCDIIIADPTPRAITHFDSLVNAAKNGHTFVANNCPTDAYEFGGVDFDRISFIPSAVWIEETILRFWEPADPSHVSFSATNLQATKRSIEVPATTIEGLLKQSGNTGRDIALLKLDVEGAEIPVLRQLLETGIRPHQILVEFDEVQWPTRTAISDLHNIVSGLNREGYRLLHFDGHANCLFYRGSESA